MNEDSTDLLTDAVTEAAPQNGPDGAAETERLRQDFQNRLLAANLRTEAVKAGMIDLDGLKLIDTAGVQLDQNDNIVGGRTLMADLRRNKPWLFSHASSSSSAVAPASQPVRQKSALEMTNDEYVAARNAITRY